MNTPSEDQNLKELVEGLDVGTFSSYETTFGRGQDIPFKKKPAQQFLGKLGVVGNPNAQLSTKSDGHALSDKGSPDVSVSSFDDKIRAELKITGARSDELLASSEIPSNFVIKKTP